MNMSQIQAYTFDFLTDLSENNNREWFLANKKSYEAAKKNILTFTTELLGAITPLDTSLDGIDPKKCLFRINRDVRFSKDKSPYKTNFGISMSKGGKKVMSAGYYVNVQPNETFVGGGLYMPMPEDVKKIREEIDYNFEEFLGIINAKSFTDYYGTMQCEETLSLKRPPKGYEADNPAIEYLKWKSYTSVRSFKNEEVVSADFIDTCVQGVAALKPLVNFLNRGMQS